MSIIQQLDWRCTIKLESVALVFITSVLGLFVWSFKLFKEKKLVLMESPLDFSNWDNPYINRVIYLNF